jgi:hypothetical protein
MEQRGFIINTIEHFREKLGVGKRNNSIKIVVHEAAILEGIRILEQSGADPDRLARHREASSEIDMIRDDPNTVHITGYDRQQVREGVGDAEYAEIYGGYRNACLDWVAEEAMDAGVIVSVNLRGSVGQ